MSFRRIAAGVLCALLMSATIVPATPSCGRDTSNERLACCRNAASCPMHPVTCAQIDSGSDFGNVTDHASIAVQQRAVLAADVTLPDVPETLHAFAVTADALLWSPAIPPTPPPRLG
jgi:hypothetical protein